MRFLKALLAVVPGPVVLWLGLYVDLYNKTSLTHPDWQIDAQNIALAVGAVEAIAIAILLKDATIRRLRTLSSLLFLGFLACLMFCWSCWSILGNGMPISAAKTWQESWKASYILSMLFLVGTISTASLLLKNRSRTTITRWALPIGVALVATLTAAAWIFRK